MGHHAIVLQPLDNLNILDQMCRYRSNLNRKKQIKSGIQRLAARWALPKIKHCLPQNLEEKQDHLQRGNLLHNLGFLTCQRDGQARD